MNFKAQMSAIELGVISNVLYTAAVIAAQYIYSRTAHRNPSYRRIRFVGFVCVWGIWNIASFCLLADWWLVFLITSVIMAGIVFQELNQFWQIGLVGADQEIKSGINYVTALGMCNNSFRFLGIGAAKLTQNREVFRDAIDRCNRAAPVRLLLSRPDDPELEQSARNARREKDSYKTTVTESLRFIASLHNEERKNIEVRFYRTLPAFRLMFIDDSICLMSYYIMGKGDGSNIPQLHIIKTLGVQDTQALYFGFNEYFEKIWNDSEAWNFMEFL
jgi:hypothetical protein